MGWEFNVDSICGRRFIFGLAGCLQYLIFRDYILFFYLSFGRLGLFYVSQPMIMEENYQIISGIGYGIGYCLLALLFRYFSLALLLVIIY